MPDYLTGDLWAGIAAVRIGERRIQEMVERYGKGTFLTAVERYLDLGEQMSLAGINHLPKGTYTLAEEQDDGQIYKVAIEIGDRHVEIDLTDNPAQHSGPFNMSADKAVITCQLAFKNLTSPKRLTNGGSFRPLTVKLQEGTVFNPHRPAAMGIYYEMGIRLYDLILRCLAQAMPKRVPAGGFASICGTLFGGVHPDTGRSYAVIEPEIGGWGGSHHADGAGGQFSQTHGETYNCPAEIAEARYGVTVDYLGYHAEPAGAGQFRGGKGVRIDYRIRSADAWLTVAYTRSIQPPWPLKGGRPGSGNHVMIRRADGLTERHAVVSGLKLKKDDVIQIMTGTGAGWGDPKKRDRELVAADLKNEFITAEEASTIYGYHTN